MEIVIPCSTGANKVVKTMHPQGSSTSISQQSHLPQGLSNMHTNTNVAHSFSSQHTFSLNMTGSAGSFISQNQDQPPPSNHPVTNASSAGQVFNLQKSSHSGSTSTGQVHSIASVQAIASIAPKITETSLLEKSQSNGTSEGAPLQQPFSQIGFSSPQKEKPLPLAKPQPMDVNPPMVQVETKQKPIIPSSSPSKSEKVDISIPAPTTDSSVVHVPAEIRPPKEAESPLSSTTAQSENDVSMELSAPASEKDPLEIPEEDLPEVPEKIVNSEPKVQLATQEEVKVGNDLHKKADPLNIDVTKVAPFTGSTKEERTVQKTEKTTVKATPRKMKTTPIKAKSPTTNATISTPASSSGIGSVKRQRIRTQHYQSPLPEVEFISKISTSSLKNHDEKLIVFYKNEFLAVRNAEGGFYLCQAIQNIYKSSSKIRIRWLSQDKAVGDVYTPDFYDLIDFDCILTNLSLSKAVKGKYKLPAAEKTRTESILNRSLAVEKGEEISTPSLTEEHPDGLDLSLYRDEDQLKKRKARKRSRKAPPASVVETETPVKKSPKAPKVRKVSPPATVAPLKKVVAKKPAPPAKKSIVTTAPKVAITTTKPSKAPGKGNNKASTKTSPVVDQKKAKVLARIGRKVAPPAPTKATKNNSKNEKPGSKPVASYNKTAIPKSSSNGSVKTSPRAVRKSTRK